MSEFEDFENDYVVEEERTSSPFLPIAGLLIAILVLTVICAGIIWLINGQGLGGNGEEDQAFNATSTAVAIANATTLAQNEGVTATLMAMTEEASEPPATDTPEPPSPTEEEASSPTVDTPETDEPGDTEEGAAGEGTDESTGEGTDESAGEGTDESAGEGTGDTTGDETDSSAGDMTEEPVVEGTTIFENDGQGGTPTPIPELGGGGGGPEEESTLPETGLGIVEAIGIALGLLVVFIIARRMRTS